MKRENVIVPSWVSSLLSNMKVSGISKIYEGIYRYEVLKEIVPDDFFSAKQSNAKMIYTALIESGALENA